MDQVPEAESYERDFDPQSYLNAFYRNESNGVENLSKFGLDCFHNVFKQGQYKGGKLLDIGTGPTVHSVISASRHVTEIHLSDLVPSNLDILQRWRDGEPNAVSCFDYVLELENDGTSLEDRSAYVREKVTRVLPIDIRLPEPLPDSSNQYDVIIASLSLVTIVQKRQDLTDALHKIYKMLKDDGILIIVNPLGGRFYRVGQVKFGHAGLGRDDTKACLGEAGFRTEVWREMKEGNYSQIDTSKGVTMVDDFFFAVCRKVVQN